MLLPRASRIVFTALLLICAVSLRAAETEAPPRTGFDVLYQAGIDASQNQRWLEASTLLNDALSLLGDRENANKRVAQSLKVVADHEYKKQNTLHTANELLRLKRWAHAEAAFLEAEKLSGPTAVIQKGIAAAQQGAIQENEFLRRALTQSKAAEFEAALASLDQARLALGEMAYIQARREEVERNRDVAAKLGEARAHAALGDLEAARNAVLAALERGGKTPEIETARVEIEKSVRELRFKQLFSAAQQELAQGNDDPPQAHEADDDPELKERLVKAIQNQRRALQNGKKKEGDF